MPHDNSDFQLVRDKITYDFAQTYGCSCPDGHKTFTYKSRVSQEDLQVHCPHCGKQCYVTHRQ